MVLIPLTSVHEYTTRGHHTQNDARGNLCVVLRADRYLVLRTTVRIAGTPYPKGTEVRLDPNGGVITR